MKYLIEKTINLKKRDLIKQINFLSCPILEFLVDSTYLL